MNKRNNLRLYEFHKTLYHKALDDAANYAPLEAPSIIRYSEQFYKSLPSKYSKSSLDQVISRIEDSEVLLYGDFHTHRQTQKGLIRILENYISFNPEREIVLAMEMFRAKDQEYLNRFLKEGISEEQLIKLCEYEKYWGFPWENYRPIIEMAKSHNIQIIGINTDLAGKDRLPKRDRFAASILLDITIRYPESLCVCLIGEYHLADAHLPYFINQHQIRNIRILTNIDEFYFSRPRLADYHSTEYLYLKEGLYCLLNSPPWIKWQSYSLWEEMKAAEDTYDSSLHTDESFDIDYQIVSILTHLTEFLGLSFRESEISDFHCYCQLSSVDIVRLANDTSISSYTRTLLKQRLQIDKAFYIPDRKIVLLDTISLNHLSEIAGQILFNALHPLASHAQPEDRFLHRILMISAGLLTSKTLNPRFKSPDIFTFEENLKKLSYKRLNHGDKVYRDALKYVVRLYYRFLLGRCAINKSIITRDQENHGIYSLMIGQILGMETYQTIMRPQNSFDFHQAYQCSKQKTPIKTLFRSVVKKIFQGK